MLKHINLLWRAPALSADAFRQLYETRHIPLLGQIAPSLMEYRRNFFLPGTMFIPEHLKNIPPEPTFDAFSSLKFQSRADFDRIRAPLKAPDVREKITEDAARFLDTARTISYFAEEFSSPQHEMQPRPDGFTGQPEMKLICVLKRRPDISRLEFREYYEGHHAPLATHLLTQYAGYRRSYTLPSDDDRLPPEAGMGRMPDFDVLTEIWFWTRADFDEFSATAQTPENSARIAADEENLFDRSAIIMFQVDERITEKAPV